LRGEFHRFWSPQPAGRPGDLNCNDDDDDEFDVDGGDGDDDDEHCGHDRKLNLTGWLMMMKMKTVKVMMVWWKKLILVEKLKY
jgi:hypothetical protein